MTDLETPMGNAELRLSLANIESEVVDVKRIALETHEQAKRTNGRVSWLEKLAWITIGALPILSFMAIFQWYTIFGSPDFQTHTSLVTKVGP